MKLEEELSVKGFRTERQKLHLNLIYTYNWMIERLQKVFRANGITMQQFNILRILRGQAGKPATIQLLKDRMMDKQPDASRLVDRLTNKNLVRRQVCKGDRRKMDVFISEQGLALLAQMEDSVNEFDKMFDLIEDNEVKQLNDLLDRIRDKK
ncbi:MAG TPA: MarR family transcriptional regulator [Bacteroidetes bacterium]|nr:MarR family transcriptional regulator [Bacteroidota bacterium]